MQDTNQNLQSLHYFSMHSCKSYPHKSSPRTPSALQRLVTPLWKKGKKKRKKNRYTTTNTHPPCCPSNRVPKYQKQYQQK